MTLLNPLEGKLIQLVYIGQGENSKRQLFNRYLLLDAEGKVTDKAMTFSASAKGQRLYMAGAIGTIYEVEQVNDSIYPSTARHCGRYDDAERVVKWQAEHQTLKAFRKAKSDKKVQDSFNQVKDDLKHVKSAYWRLSSAQRALFLAQIVEYLHHEQRVGDKWL